MVHIQPQLCTVLYAATAQIRDEQTPRPVRTRAQEGRPNCRRCCPSSRFRLGSPLNVAFPPYWMNARPRARQRDVHNPRVAVKAERLLTPLNAPVRTWYEQHSEARVMHQVGVKVARSTHRLLAGSPTLACKRAGQGDRANAPAVRPAAEVVVRHHPTVGEAAVPVRRINRRMRACPQCPAPSREEVFHNSLRLHCTGT